MDSTISIDDIVYIGGGHYVPTIALANALFRTGQLIAIGGGQSIGRKALADALIRSGDLTPNGRVA
jgi:hypothetical protein